MPYYLPSGKGSYTYFDAKNEFWTNHFPGRSHFPERSKYNDQVSINLQLINARRDYTRWTIRLEVIRNYEVICAIINIDGAWLNWIDRKLMIPPIEAIRVFKQMTLNENFQWLN